MPLKRLKEFLDQNKVRYSVQSHMTAYTASGVASAAHVKGREMAKTVMVLADSKLVMLVVPSSTHIKIRMVKTALRAHDVSLASEKDFAHVFPDCEVGAMPPFGNLYGVPVYVDEALTKDKEIAFNAGNHRELMRLRYPDYERVVSPILVNVASHTAGERIEEAMESRSF